MSKINSSGVSALKYIDNDVYLLRQTTKLALIYDSLDQQKILKCYLPARTQVGRTIMRTVMPIHSAIEGYQLVKEKLPEESILIDQNEESRYILLRRIKGTPLVELFPPSQVIVGNILKKLQQWDAAGLFHNTITPENILVDAEQGVHFVDFDDVFLSNQLLIPTSNFASFLTHTIHSLILDENCETRDKLVFVEALSREFRAFSWKGLELVAKMFLEPSAKVLSTFRFAGNLLKLVFHFASGWLQESSLKVQTAALLASVTEVDFDPSLAADYLSLFLSLDAREDIHKRGLLNPISLLNHTPTAIILSSSANLQNSQVIGRVLDTPKGAGQMIVVSDERSPVNIPGLNSEMTARNFDLVHVRTDKVFPLSSSLIILFETSPIDVDDLPLVVFNRSLESLFHLQLISEGVK